MDLLFKHPVMNLDTPNVSVRRGIKWAVELASHNKFDVLDADTKEFVGVAEVLESKVCRFCDLTSTDIRHEHDPQCRDYSGLLSVMQDVYPGFDEKEIVTVLAFNFTQSERK